MFVINEVKWILQLKKLWIPAVERSGRRGCLRGKESSLGQMNFSRMSIHLPKPMYPAFQMIPALWAVRAQDQPDMSSPVFQFKSPSTVSTCYL